MVLIRPKVKRRNLIVMYYNKTTYDNYFVFTGN
jgi:hypothetical protein